MTEMIVIGVIALLVVGPKDLPRLFKGIAGFMRQLRKLTREFQGVVNDMIRESDLDDLRKEAQDLRSNINPTQDLRDAMRETENEINEASNAVSNPFSQVTTSSEAAGPADTSEPAPTAAAAAKTTPAVKKAVVVRKAASAKKASPAKKAASAKKTTTTKKTTTAASRSKASD